MATFHLQIVTPDRSAYDGEAMQIVIRTLGGDVCILPRHIDYAAPLGIGECRVTDAHGKVRQAACNGGLMSVAGGNVRVAATTFEWEDEIDLRRAEMAQEEAEALLRDTKRTDAQYKVLEAKVKRALIRQQVGR